MCILNATFGVSVFYVSRHTATNQYKTMHKTISFKSVVGFFDEFVRLMWKTNLFWYLIIFCVFSAFENNNQTPDSERPLLMDCQPNQNYSKHDYLFCESFIIWNYVFFRSLCELHSWKHKQKSSCFENFLKILTENARKFGASRNGILIIFSVFHGNQALVSKIYFFGRFNRHMF